MAELDPKFYKELAVNLRVERQKLINRGGSNHLKLIALEGFNAAVDVFVFMLKKDNDTFDLGKFLAGVTKE